jgi:hypothetical protein
MARKAGPRPPVEVTYLDFYASGTLEDEGVAVSVLARSRRTSPSVPGLPSLGRPALTASPAEGAD